MATVSTTAPRLAAAEREQIADRRRMRLAESLLGLAFVAPVAIVAIVFRLFPVVLGFYISMQDGTNIPEGFVGLEHYVEAIGSLAYMIALAIAVVFAIGGYGLYSRARAAMQEGGGNFYNYLIPGFTTGIATLLFFGVAFRLNLSYTGIPILLFAAGVALYVYLRQQGGDKYDRSSLLYMVNSWGVGLLTTCAVLLAVFTFAELHSFVAPLPALIPQVVTDRRVNYVFDLFPQILALGGMVAGVAGLFFSHLTRKHMDAAQTPRAYALIGLARVFLIAAIAGLLFYILSAQDSLRTSVNALSGVSAEALRAVTRIRLPALVDGLTLWQEVSTMILGVGMIGSAAYLWFNARKRDTSLGMMSAIFIAICLMVGGWAFIGELPVAASAGDPEFYQSLLRTATYAMLTVPIELGLGLGLAYLLFFEVNRGKGLFRLIYFMPYIAPTVATAAVFAMIFTSSPLGPMNQVLQAFGLPAQEWLRNPKGVFQIIAEIIGGSSTRLPSFLVGPSLPLVAAILYGIWVFSGYNAVVFMAGLGTVPKEIHEAAQVDGANRWTTFREIIFPLISPTTYLLTMLAIIGTFQAFTHIYVLRREDARGAMDTTTVYIFETIRTASVIKTRPYAAALSFMLFGIILILTLVQNRLSRDRVFYG